MPRTAAALVSTPPSVAQALRALGEDLAVARVRRKESQRVWAQRLGVSIPTLIRMERGEASVAIGVYATALWLIGRVPALSELADPKHDLGALERDVRQARQRKAVRSAPSVSKRLGGAET